MTTGDGIEQETKPNQTELPWKKEDVRHDKSGINRVRFLVDAKKLGFDVDVTLPILFKHSLDPIKSSEIDGKTYVVRKRLDSVINLVRDYFNVKNEEMESFASDKVPRPSNFNYSLLDGLAACAIFDENGSIKPFDDGEGWLLLTTYFITSVKNPPLAENIKKHLLERSKLLDFLDDTSNQESTRQKVLVEKPSWGEVPFDNIWNVHVTNYLPKAGKDYVAILPRIDTDGAPRWTIHTYSNGMVEEHTTNGVSKTSWESGKYAIGINFEELIKDPNISLPVSVFRPDTFWQLKPGQGLRLPKGSFIVVPDNEAGECQKMYQDFGIEVIGFDPSQASLRQALKEQFTSKNIPFLEKIHPLNPTTEDEVFSQHLVARHTAHSSLPLSTMERLLIFADTAMRKAQRIITEDGKFSEDEARSLSVLTDQLTSIQYKPKTQALALTIKNSREMVLLETGLKENVFGKTNRDAGKEALITALIANLL